MPGFVLARPAEHGLGPWGRRLLITGRLMALQSAVKSGK
jgi:hypothetical protein